MKDFYYILGLNQNCTLDEVKEAYRKLSKKFHPDLNQGDKYFESQFREVKDAYETLSDPIKRGQYDAALKKTKSSAGEPGNQQYHREQYKNSTSQARPSGFTRPTRKGPGIMGITLILLALIFGVYAVESFSGSKAKMVAPLYKSAVIANKGHKHHKKKFILKNKAAIALFKPKPDSAILKRVAPKAVDVKIKQPAVISNKAPISIETKKTYDKTNFLYATYVRPNVTGVVYMRKADNYNSIVIKNIPANSEVFVLEKGDTYYKVSFNNQEGYIPKWSLQVK